MGRLTPVTNKVQNGGSTASPEISYLANEGFLIAANGKKVLIDGLFGQGVESYAVLSTANREKLESAASPFDGVDLALALVADGRRLRFEECSRMGGAFAD